MALIVNWATLPRAVAVTESERALDYRDEGMN